MTKTLCFLFIFLVLALVCGQNLRAGDDAKWTVLALGDSTTAGTPGFRSPVEAPPRGLGDEKSQYAHWVAQKHPGWIVLNQGVNGQRSDQILRRFEHEAAFSRPDAVVVLAGVVDIFQGYPAEHVEKNLERIYRLALSGGAKVAACTILPYEESTARAKNEMAKVNEWIRNYSREHKLLFCDTFSVMNDPKNPGNLAGTPDGLHPDVEGYRKMGEAIAEVLENGLPGKDQEG